MVTFHICIEKKTILTHVSPVCLNFAGQLRIALTRDMQVETY